MMENAINYTAAYRLDINPNLWFEEEQKQKLKNILEQYKPSKKGKKINMELLLEELKKLGLCIWTFVSLTKFNYLDKSWAVLLDDSDFEVIELDYKTHFIDYSQAVEKLFEEAYKFLERLENEDEEN